MKSVSLLIIALFALNLSAQSLQPSIVPTEFHTGYIPEGFDSNDHVQFVVEGTFSNTCYRPAAYGVKVDVEAKKITLSPRAYAYQSGMCSMMLVQYSQVIDIHQMLPDGNYEVVQDGTYIKNLGQLKVNLAKNASPDDFLYAPISQAYITQANNKVNLNLTGEFTNSCSKIIELKTEVSGNVIIAQPIVEMGEGVPCIDKVVPFNVTKEISGLNKGRYLLHIRSSNAKAVNNLVDIY